MTWTEPCPDCSGELTVAVTQTVRGRALYWTRSLRCLSCGLAMEEDGVGFPPESFRRQLLQEDGRWRVSVPGPDRTATVKTLRAALGLELRQASSLLRADPARIWEGTRAEVEWLVRCLQDEGVEAEARRP